jgi:hypothetical protein
MGDTEKAWRHPIHGAMVVMPDGYTMTANQAALKGIKPVPWPNDLARTATPHPHDSKLVVLARGATAERDRAIAAGFTIQESPLPAIETRSAFSVWRSAIMLLPDARERPSATAELLSTQTPRSLTVLAARAFLRGLPTEHSEEETTLTNENDPRAARRAELAASMDGFNRSMGYAPRRSAAAPTRPRLDANAVDQTRLRRMAEIRLNALQMNGSNPQEAKQLKNVLDAHAATGTPLVRIMSQQGIDITKFVPNA